MRSTTSNPDLCEHPRCPELSVLSCGGKSTLPSRVYLFRANRVLRLWCFARMGQLRGCKREVRSFLHRISLQFGKRYHRPILRLGPVLHRDSAGHPQMCIRTRDCIRDIESFSVSHPWATSIELENYRVGWEAGARWASRNRCSCM